MGAFRIRVIDGHLVLEFCHAFDTLSLLAPLFVSFVLQKFVVARYLFLGSSLPFLDDSPWMLISVRRPCGPAPLCGDACICHDVLLFWNRQVVELSNVGINADLQKFDLETFPSPDSHAPPCQYASPYYTTTA